MTLTEINERSSLMSDPQSEMIGTLAAEIVALKMRVGDIEQRQPAVTTSPPCVNQVTGDDPHSTVTILPADPEAFAKAHASAAPPDYSKYYGDWDHIDNSRGCLIFYRIGPNGICAVSYTHSDTMESLISVGEARKMIDSGKLTRIDPPNPPAEPSATIRTPGQMYVESRVWPKNELHMLEEIAKAIDAEIKRAVKAENDRCIMRLIECDVAPRLMKELCNAIRRRGEGKATK